jgi:acyl-coenzyme A synthetase/AMP-(fatty) acid ligase
MMTSLWDSVARAGTSLAGALHGAGGSVALAELETGSCLDIERESLRGRSVLLALREQMSTALALIELDGIARRLVLCTPELSAERLAEVAASAQTDVTLADGELEISGEYGPVHRVRRLQSRPGHARPARAPGEPRTAATSEWILLTSGTTGAPKLVAHSLASLAGFLPRQPPETGSVWSTFYDIRRYGGLQIYLRAVLSGCPLVLSSPSEPTEDFLARAGAQGVTHISGTPSHWRRALMSGAAGRMNPKYVRLSGEVADQVVLDQLRATFPGARIGHAFASTEAGVAFEVDDGLAGFPAEFLNGGARGVDMKVQDGTLRIRSQRIAGGYLGTAPADLSEEDGYVDTGDLVELQDGRYYFRGRKGGVINVGGLKVYPEEVESVLNADPRVRMSLVRARRNSIMGAVVVADVVLNDHAAERSAEEIKSELLQACRRALPAHKVPAMLRLVPALELTAAGKLVRPGA